MHLFAERLTSRSAAQLSLFDVGDGRSEAIAKVKREVNRRHGRFVIRSGATLPLGEVYRDAANSFDICDVRGKICF
jgi:hypothetical protein